MADEGEEVVPSAAAADRGPDRAADRAVDVVFAFVLVATMAVWFRLTRNTWFFLDEWALAGRGRSLGDFLEPYNGHLSVTYLAVYRAHMELFGFGSYTLLRVLGLVALASGPVLLYLTTRRALGPMAAGIAAIAVLWAEGVSLEPGAMNHSAVVACSVVAAWAARSTGRRADRWLLGALTLGFLTAGGMVATAAALVVGAALTRAGSRRWLAILVPTGVWAAWYVLQDRPPIPEEHRIDVGDALRLVVDGFAATLRGVAGGSALGGALLLVVLVAVGDPAGPGARATGGREPRELERGIGGLVAGPGAEPAGPRRPRDVSLPPPVLGLHRPVARAGGAVAGPLRCPGTRCPLVGGRPGGGGRRRRCGPRPGQHRRGTRTRPRRSRRTGARLAGSGWS